MAKRGTTKRRGAAGIAVIDGDERPRMGRVTSVTLSAGGKSVTMTGERFQQASAEVQRRARRGELRRESVDTETGEVIQDGEDTGGTPVPPRASRRSSLLEEARLGSVRLVKVKREATRVLIEWERERGDGAGAGSTADDPASKDGGKVSEGWDAFSMKCADEPASSFEDAMDAAARQALKDIGLGILRDRATFGSVSFSWAKDIMGATVTARVNVDARQSPLILTVPHAPSASYSENPGGESEGGDGLLSAELVSLLQTLADEAWRYVDGKRGQMGLFEQDRDDVAGDDS